MKNKTQQQRQKGHASCSNEQTKGELENAIRLITEQLDDDKKGKFYCVYHWLRYYKGKVQQVFAPICLYCWDYKFYVVNSNMMKLKL